MGHQPSTDRCCACGRAIASRGRWCRDCAEYASRYVTTPNGGPAPVRSGREGLGIGTCVACGRPISISSTWCRSCASRVSAFLSHYRYPRKARSGERSRLELTENEVRLIRGLGDRIDLREVAEVFGVSEATIRRVRAEIPLRSRDRLPVI